ncbi:hypothetical protein MCT03_16965 [Vibrio aestuarianus]|nr:hypothetical protein [Vibrio aestuarianus]
MIENIAYFLDSQPFITLFLVIGIGYAVGKINVGGFSLGIGAVLFVGLAFGAIAPNATPPGLLGLMGLVLFLYGIGIQYGRHFFFWVSKLIRYQSQSVSGYRCVGRFWNCRFA